MPQFKIFTHIKLGSLYLQIQLGCQYKSTTATRVPLAEAVFFTSAPSCHGCHRRIGMKNMLLLNLLFIVDSSRNGKLRRLEPSQRSWSQEGSRTRTRQI